MWALQNHTPLAADRTFLQDAAGTMRWIVVVRATYDVSPTGEVALSKEQQPVRLAPVYRDEQGASSLLHAGDMVLAKPTTDVLLLGQAHAPGARPTTDMLVNMQVGPVSKRLRVVGPRRWREGGAGLGLTAPAPFVRMELCYENAKGGTAGDGARDPRNPVGRGFCSNQQELREQPAPCVYLPGEDEDAPGGFGPIPPDWSPRRELAGTHDERWRQERHPLAPLDRHPRFDMCAPADQWPARHLAGGERVLLQNLTPEGALSFSLPRVALTLATRLAGRTVEHEAALHTVLLEPDLRRVQLAWHTSLACDGQEQSLEYTEIRAVLDGEGGS